MIGLAISVLWLALGVIALLGCVWLLLRAVTLFVPIEPRVVQAIWLIVLILCIIGGLTLLSGGGGGTGFPHFR
jgi:hypothetical protein